MRTRICLTGQPSELVRLAQHETAPLARPEVEAVVVACPATAEERSLVAGLRAAADRHDVAFLVADDQDLADEVAADGVEIAWQRDIYDAARDRFGDGRSVGCRVGLSRHLAMQAAEAGCDYVLFRPGGQTRGDIEAMIAQAAWWAEIFEVACMAAGTGEADDIMALTRAGVDFVALDACLPPDRIGALIAAAGGLCEGAS